MYIQITTKCNMSCEHCIFSCEQGKPGEFMSRETFKKALSYAEGYGAFITIGGGEPTIHPKFWEFFGLAMASDVEGVWMATNGSVTKTALALARIAKGDDHFFGIALSQDYYHDPIDERVVETFNNYGLEIRDVSEHVINKGAALDNGVGVEDDKCGCNDLHITPDGTVKMCGCPDSLVLGDLDVLDDHEMMSRVGDVGEETDHCGDNLSQRQIDYIFGRVDSLEDDDEDELLDIAA